MQLRSLASELCERGLSGGCGVGVPESHAVCKVPVFCALLQSYLVVSDKARDAAAVLVSK